MLIFDKYIYFKILFVYYLYMIYYNNVYLDKI